VPQSGSGQVYSYIYYSYAPTFGLVSTTANTSTSYYQSADDILLFSTQGIDLDTASGTQTVLFIGSGNMGPTNSATTINSIDYVSAQNYLNAYGRRIAGVQFSPDSESLIFTYQSHNSYNPKYMGSAYQYTINASSRSSTYWPATARISVRFNFRTSSGGAINFASSPGLSNMLAGLSGVGGVGTTSAPFGPNSSSTQQFWSTFRSHNGQFLYYISDDTNGRNHMVGFNISASTVNGHDPWAPFSTHGSSIGFEQFDCNAWNYEGRFFAVPAGVTYRGRDGAGIVFVIGSDASAGATSATDLEVYAFDANIGGDLVNLTADVTDGTANAINHMYASADGNFLVGQRAETAADSGDSRAVLNSNSDLFAVVNVHAALNGAAPVAFMLSEDMSHGSSVAFVGERTASGPAAIVFSSGPKGSTNATWDDRTVKIIPMTPGSTPVVLDSAQSHYVVLAGSRKLDDDPDTSN
jgi:hypothetical protein